MEFTEDQLKQKASELASKINRRNQLENEKKAAVTGYKGRIDVLEAEIDLLANHVGEGREFMNVECVAKLDYPWFGKKSIYRTDTGAYVGEEDMTTEDRQMKIQWDRKNAAGANPLATPERAEQTTQEPAEEPVQAEPEPEAVEQPVDVPAPAESGEEPQSMDAGVVEHDTAGRENEGSEDEPKSLLQELGQE